MPSVGSSSQPAYARAPVIGAAFGLVLVLSPVALGARGYLLFFSFVGLVVVVGGVIAVAFMSFSASEVLRALQAIAQMFEQKPLRADDLSADLACIVQWSAEIRSKGLRSFEASIKGFHFKDPVVKYGATMVLSAYGPDEVRSMMMTAADSCYEYDSRPADILQAMTSHAPAFGMVGTLIGMVAMLGHLTSDISDIGASLAVAFLSTLYGVLSARMVYMPAAARLRQEVERQHLRHQFLAEGIAMLAGKKAPSYIEDRLNGFLRPQAHSFAPGPVPLARPMLSARLKVVNSVIRLRRASREHPHIDDWLITYADMITLLLCFFVIFYVIMSMRKNAPQETPQPASAAQVMQNSAEARASAPHVVQGDFVPDGFGKFDVPQIAPTRLAPIVHAPAKPEAAPKGDRITAFEVGGSELFDNGSAILREDGKSALQGIAAQIQSDRYDGYQIVVEGHTDDSPIATAQFSSNWELSMARAAAVVHFLLDQGIAANRLRAAGYGDTEPKLPNRNADGSAIPENQAQNRRVVIRLEKIQTPE